MQPLSVPHRSLCRKRAQEPVFLVRQEVTATALFPGSSSASLALVAENALQTFRKLQRSRSLLGGFYSEEPAKARYPYYCGAD